MSSREKVLGRKAIQQQAHPGGETEERPARKAPRPHVIHPNAVYRMADLQAALGLTNNCISREIQLGRLRASRRGKWYFILGRWVLAWLAAGEVHSSSAKGVSGPCPVIRFTGVQTLFRRRPGDDSGEFLDPLPPTGPAGAA